VVVWQIVADMTSRLQWYTENQEILDKNDGLLHSQAAKISELEAEVKMLREENSRMHNDLDTSGANGEGKAVKALKKKISALEGEIVAMKKDAKGDNVVADLLKVMINFPNSHNSLRVPYQSFPWDFAEHGHSKYCVPRNTLNSSSSRL